MKRLFLRVGIVLIVAACALATRTATTQAQSADAAAQPAAANQKDEVSDADEPSDPRITIHTVMNVPPDDSERDAPTDSAGPDKGQHPAKQPRGAADHTPPSDTWLKLADPRTYRLRVVHRVDAPDGAVRNVVVLGPIPMDWPEQHVRLLSEKKPPEGRTSEQVIKGHASLLRFQVPSIPKGGSVTVERLYEITRYRTQFTLPSEELTIARMTPRDFRDQLAGPAPGVETSNPKMVELAELLRKAKEDEDAWATVRNFWQWTRDNVKFQNGDFRGALYAIENRCGDCEEMSALFVGLCRLSGVAARTVWVEGHDYPEFYLADRQGHGHWIPAQVVGPPWFGEITEYRPIFQKGDRFYDPLQRQYVRYVPHTVRADGDAPPKLTVKHEIIADTDINGPAYNNAK